MTPGDDRASRRGWLIWGLGASFFCFGFFQRVAPSVMVADLMRDFAVGAAALGNLSAFYFYAYAGLQIPVGVMADRWGPRRLLISSAALCGAGSALFGVADGLWMASIGRLLIGAGAGFAFVCTLKLAAAWFPTHRFALLSGLTIMLGMIGGIGGQAPLAALVGAVGWRATQLGAAGVALLLMAAIWLLVRDRPEASAALPGTLPGGRLLDGLRLTLRNPQSWVLALCGVASTAPMLAYGGLWGVPYLMAEHGLSKPAAAASVSLVLVGWAVGGPLLGWLSDRLRRRKAPMVAGAALSLVSFAALVYIDGLSLLADQVLMFAHGFGGGAMIITYATGREHNQPQAAGATLGFINMTVVGSGALFQPVLGWTLDQAWDGTLIQGARIYAPANFETAFLWLVGCGATGLLAALMVRETRCLPVAPDAS